MGLSVTGFRVGCPVGLPVTGFKLGCLLGLLVTGLEVGSIVGLEGRLIKSLIWSNVGVTMGALLVDGLSLGEGLGSNVDGDWLGFFEGDWLGLDVGEVLGSNV